MTALLVILWLFWVVAWLALFAVFTLSLMGVIALYDFVRGRYIAWRERRRDRRELDEATDFLLRIGFLANERLRDDVQ